MSRELDASVAVEIMGWVGKTREECGYEPWDDADDWDRDPCGKCWFPPDHIDGDVPSTLPCYSKDIRDAWLVVEKMRKLGMDLELSCVPLGAKAYPPDAQWLAGFHDDGPTYQEWGSTAPQAICKAALKAVEE